MRVSFLSTLKENLTLWILAISSVPHATGNRNSGNYAEIMLAWLLKTGGHPLSHHIEWNRDGWNEAAPNTELATV